jgi:hypothetical protein
MAEHNTALESEVLSRLADGPRSSRELGVDAMLLRGMESAGLIRVDPDPWPDEYVPGNPLIARLPTDDSRWPGWDRWNR